MRCLITSFRDLLVRPVWPYFVPLEKRLELRGGGKRKGEEREREGRVVNMSLGGRCEEHSDELKGVYSI